MIKQNLTRLTQAIRAAENTYQRQPHSVTLMAVSKAQDSHKIQTAIDCGQKHFGENYLQEALGKIRQINNPELIWHYIGKLQTKKTKLIAQNFAWVDTVDSYAMAALLNQHRPKHLPKLNICIQVNISQQATKGGVLLPELAPLAHQISQLPNLQLRGIMAIPQPLETFAEQFQVFNELNLAFQQLQHHHSTLDILNLGMSQDYVAAIAANANMIRIGTAIFGDRTN